MTAPRDPTPSIATDRLESAARWCARLHAQDCDATDRAQFEQWCLEDPEHVVAWLEVSELHELARGLGEAGMAPDIAPTRHRRQAPARGRGWRRLGLSLAAAAALVIAVGVYRYGTGRSGVEPVVHATAVGEQRHLVLDDGSTIALDTDSRVQVRMDRATRELVVERGRLGVTVARDERPFAVVAGRGRVVDIGTQFQVAKHGDGVEVVLIEGLVDVDLGDRSRPTRLLPGQKVAYGKEGAMGLVQAADMEAARAWPTGKIAFAQRRLDELLVDINRYSTRPIRLADPSMGAQKVSGVFDVRDQQALLDALAAGWGLVAERDGGDEIVLQRRSR